MFVVNCLGDGCPWARPSNSSCVGSELELDPRSDALSLFPQLRRRARVESEGSSAGDGGAGIPTADVAALARDGDEW